MVALAFHKVTVIPGSPAPDAFYFVENGGIAESYLTDDTGVLRSIGNSSMISSLISTALSSTNLVEVAADITARNVLSAAASRNLLCLVTDATGDATVTSGAAFYAWNDVAGTWTKVAEFESLDLVLSWVNITGKPSSSPAAIDTAVSQSHVHSNIAVLGLLTAPSGALNYNGSPVDTGGQWSTQNW